MLNYNRIQYSMDIIPKVHMLTCYTLLGGQLHNEINSCTV